ncbi:hypothetical protein CRG98_021595 [Punica granatum]|uniref:Uncharacterized protein n=1 Tax=Punica granatum TaxID=22663 RepID=A0A2I0JNZ4_PUNGR|nr:hypothetical protein CRG98_021595 [Punica granatum]
MPTRRKRTYTGQVEKRNLRHGTGNLGQLRQQRTPNQARGIGDWGMVRWRIRGQLRLPTGGMVRTEGGGISAADQFRGDTQLEREEIRVCGREVV